MRVKAPATGARFASGTGIYALKPNEIRNIPDHMYSQAAAQGCRPAEGEPEPEVPQEADYEDIKRVLALMITDGEQDEFTAYGRPKVSAVRKRLGIDTVTADQVNQAFEELSMVDDGDGEDDGE